MWCATSIPAAHNSLEFPGSLDTRNLELRMNRTITIVALLGLCACGGGAVTVEANLSSAPGEAALVNYLQGTHQYTLHATDSSGNSYTLQLTSTPDSTPTTFDGEAPAYGTTNALTLDEPGALVVNLLSTSYYLLNPYVPLGKSYSTGTPYGLATSSTPLPTTLNVGGTAALVSIALTVNGETLNFT